MSDKKSNEVLVDEIQTGVNIDKNLLALYEQNKGLIIRIIRKWNIKADFFEDAMQDAYFAVVYAANNYTAEKEATFSTYLSYTLLKYVLRPYMNSYNQFLYVPPGVKELYIKLVKARSSLYEKLNREPTLAELSAETNIPVEKIIEVENANHEAISIDQQVYDDSEATIENTIADESSNREFEEVNVSDTFIILQQAVNKLDPVLRKSITLNFYDNCSIKKIAKMQGITVYQARANIERAIKLLRSNKQIQELKNNY